VNPIFDVEGRFCIVFELAGEFSSAMSNTKTASLAHVNRVLRRAICRPGKDKTQDHCAGHIGPARLSLPSNSDEQLAGKTSRIGQFHATFDMAIAPIGSLGP